MPELRVVILGGGPAGVGAARELARRGLAAVRLYEQGEAFGGNAGSFQACGQWLDYGSHRLHPACDPRILADIRELLGDDLVDRPRHGRIRLLGRWIHFPLQPVDLLLRLDPRFAAGSLLDMAARALPGRRRDGEDFATVLQARLGPTICHHFYFPYAKKLWGLEPGELSAVQARRRVAAGTFGKLLRKVMGAAPGLKQPGFGRFFYPRRGYGQISEAYAADARRLGADLRAGWRVSGLEAPSRAGGPWRVTAERDGASETCEADHVWSTLPIPVLARAVRPAPPAEVQDAAGAIDYRAMILVYLQLPLERFTEFDAHYFPGPDTRITRMSEPKNYSLAGEPRDTTVLCAELPCSVGDDLWRRTDAELARLLAEDLERSGIPLPVAPRAAFTRRLAQAYPVYARGYEEPFGLLDRWAGELPGLVSYGRQGLFAHDNTHHALFMAYSAADCLEGGRWDAERWRAYREVFATHVVVD